VPSFFFDCFRGRTTWVGSAFATPPFTYRPVGPRIYSAPPFVNTTRPCTAANQPGRGSFRAPRRRYSIGSSSSKRSFILLQRRSVSARASQRTSVGVWPHHVRTDRSRYRECLICCIYRPVGLLSSRASVGGRCRADRRSRADPGQDNRRLRPARPLEFRIKRGRSQMMSSFIRCSAGRNESAGV